MLLSLVTVSFQQAWRHIGQATAPLLAGSDAPLSGDGVSLAVKAPIWFGVFASLTSNNSLLLVSVAPFTCNGAHPLGYRARLTSVSAVLTRYIAYVTRDYFLRLKTAPPESRVPFLPYDGALPC